MNEDKLYDLIKEFYQYKAKMRSCNSGTKEVTWFLYESFCFTCRLEEDTNTFKIWLEAGNTGLITRFLGKVCSGDAKKEAIEERLQFIDNYCRLRLPDKFLLAYDEAYVMAACEN